MYIYCVLKAIRYYSFKGKFIYGHNIVRLPGSVIKAESCVRITNYSFFYILLEKKLVRNSYTNILLRQIKLLYLFRQ